ncbi:hypothetical protein EDC96DRAFT_590519 [Choanephora cucurbitarum]|nr:hypothetical protein EDC96DRAFT_590519 [Choanephora cucurbitarum]
MSKRSNPYSGIFFNSGAKKLTKKGAEKYFDAVRAKQMDDALKFGKWAEQNAKQEKLKEANKKERRVNGLILTKMPDYLSLLKTIFVGLKSPTRSGICYLKSYEINGRPTMSQTSVSFETCDCVCSDQKTTEITLYFMDAIRKVLVKNCSCNPLFEQLLLKQFMPASLVMPRKAFQFWNA